MADDFDWQQGAGLAALGAGIKGFAQGWQDSEDRKMKRMEMEAKVDAQKYERERNDFLDQMTMREKGYQKNPVSGGVEEMPMTQSQRDKQTLGGMEKGIKTEWDENGRPHYSYDPNSPQMVAAKKKYDGTNDLVNTRHDRIDRQEHERVLTRISSNPQVKQRLTQFQNLDNSLALLAQSDHLTPQQVHEAQQSIRSNLGLKGSSGVGEREETYLKSLGLNAAAFKQFLTGEPANISRNDALVQHIVNLARVEQKNVKAQFDSTLRAASGGHASMYSRRPDLRGDLEDYISGVSGQMTSQVPDSGLLSTGRLSTGLLGGQTMGSGDVVPQAKASQQNGGPNPGDIQDGYQYVGGEPGDPKSWKKVEKKGR